MKITYFSLFLFTFATTSFAGNFFGPGPFANDFNYPGQMDGKYQASVTGVNIAGALGFAFQDGAPSINTNAATVAGTAANTIAADPRLNYFVIFVQGVTYVGTTTATININQNTVVGALYSAANDFTTITFTEFRGVGINRVITEFEVLDNISMLNRGVNGGFTAKINSKNSLFTFSGTGELSAPAFPQSVLGFDTNGNVVAPKNFISDAVTSVVETATVPFDIQGIRVSFSGGL